MEGLLHILIIESRFYDEIADELVAGATQYLQEEKVIIEKISVPGAFEVPAAISFAIESGRYDGYVALGCVIRGETSHYDYVCGESARGLSQLAIEKKVAIGNGILTTENKKQALKRARVSEGNKGARAAEACIAMIKLKSKLAI